MKRYLASSLCLLSLALVGCGSHEVRSDPDNKLLGQGAEYHLPRTVLVVTAPVVKTSMKPGRFHFFSAPLLRKEPLTVRQGAVSYRISDEIDMKAVGEPDEGRRFVSLYKKGPFQTFNQTYKWNEEGVLAHGEAEVENRTAEFVVSTLEAASRIAKGSMAASGANFNMKWPEIADLLKYLQRLDKNNALTEKVLAFGLQVRMAKDPDKELNDSTDASKGDWIEFSNNNTAAYREIVTACENAKLVISLRETLNRTTDASGRDSIRAEINETLTEFIGTSTETTWNGTFRCAPADRPATMVSGIFRGSMTLLNLDSSGALTFPQQEPVTAPSSGFKNRAYDKPDTEPAISLHAELDAFKASANATSVTLAWDSVIPASTAGWESLLAQNRPRGWHYCLPARSTVKVRKNSDDALVKRLQIAQHGCVAFLPSTSGGQTFVSNIELDPVTGALKATAHGGAAFDPALINRTGSALSP